MPTKLCFSKNYANVFHTVGFCRESPKTVLKRVFPHYFITGYKDLDFRGLMTEERRKGYLKASALYTLPKFSGLFIREAYLERGLTVTGTLNELLQGLERDVEDLTSLTHVRLDFERTRKETRQALRELYEHWLPSDYIKNMEKRYSKEENYGRRYSQFLEIVEATLGIKKPTTRDVQRILRGR